MAENESAAPARKFKFIHYGNKYNVSHRQRAQSSTSQSVKPESNLRDNKQKLLEQKQRREERQAREARPNEQTAVELASGSVPLLNSLTSFKRDQFLSYPIRMSPDEYRLESEWFTMFQDVLYLPKLRPTSRISRPQESFFSSALMSGPAYENLIMLPAAGARAEMYGSQQLSLNHDVLRLQARALSSYRAVVSRVQESRQATRLDFEILYAITFAFMDGKDVKEKAYNAMQVSNLFMVFQLRQNYYMRIPIASWISTIMPVPGSSFKRDEKYKRFMNGQIEVMLAFVAECQAYAQTQSVAPSPFREAAFAPGTALRRILTVSLFDTNARQPHPTFFKLCKVRAVNIIFLSLLQDSTPAEEARYLNGLERLAEECVSYTGPQAMSLFLWSLFSFSNESYDAAIAQREEVLSVPSKFLLAIRGVSFASEMVAWLFQDPDEEGEIRLPLLDFDAIGQSLVVP